MAKKVEMRKCAVCGKKFTPKAANSLYCSDKCYKAAKSKRDKVRKAEKKAAKKPEKKAVKAVCNEKISVKKVKGKKVVEVNGVSPERLIIVGLRIALSGLDEIAKEMCK